MAEELDSDCRLQLRECRELAQLSAGKTVLLQEEAAETGFPSPCPHIGWYFRDVYADAFDRTKKTHHDWLTLFYDTWGQARPYALRDIQLELRRFYLEVLTWWGCFENYTEILDVRHPDGHVGREVANAIGTYASQLQRGERLIGRLRAAIHRGELSHS